MDLEAEKRGIAERVRKAYEDSGKTWRALSDETGVSEGHLQRLGKPKFEPGAIKIARFARATGAPLLWLLQGETGAKTHRSPEPRPKDENEETLVVAYRQLDKATSTALLRVLVAAGPSKGTRSLLRALALLAEEGVPKPAVEVPVEPAEKTTVGARKDRGRG